MRQDYKTLTTLSLKQKKDYLLSIDYRRDIHEGIYGCMTHKELDNLLKDEKTNKQFFIAGLKELYNSKNYDDLEYHLIMMNQLFHYQSYTDLKKQLFEKLCKKSITIDEYCILRHLISFCGITFEDFVQKLHDQFDVDDEECARICLLEDQHHLAYEYLKRLDDCQDEYLLELLCSYSIYEYTSLMRYYAKKQKRYTLAATH
ncbi:MAG: hypothetical protein RR585_14220 [Coprobacillus sp.]